MTATQDPPVETQDGTAEGAELEDAAVLGDMTLFLPDDYEVRKLNATLGGITVDAEELGLKIGDEVDLFLRGVKVTGAKSTHKGDVTLILHGTEIERA